MIQVPGRLDQTMSPVKCEQFTEYGSQTNKNKKNTGIKLIKNRFVLPKEKTEKGLAKESVKQEDAQMDSRIFLIGQRNIFKLRKIRKVRSISRIDQSGEDVLCQNDCKTGSNRGLKHYRTDNQIKTLRNVDVSSEDYSISDKEVKMDNNEKRFKRCNNCFKSHFPYPKLCRWTNCKKERKTDSSKKETLNSLKTPITLQTLKLIEEWIVDKDKVKRLLQNPSKEEHYCMNPEIENWKKGHKEQATQRKICIMKKADYCARKFMTNQHQDKKDYFLTYCIRKISPLFQDQPIPNAEEKTAMQRTLNVYDKVFYNAKSQDGCINTSEDLDEDWVIPQLDGGYDSEATI